MVTQSRKKYDERQLADRAKAVQCAFWTMCVYLLLWGVLEAGFGIILWENAFGAFLGVILGIGIWLPFGISLRCIRRGTDHTVDHGKKEVLTDSLYVGSLFLLFMLYSSCEIFLPLLLPL